MAIGFWSVSMSCFSALFSVAFICFSPWSSIAFVCFSNALPIRKLVVNLPCFIILLWIGDNISLPVIYLYLSILPDDKIDLFVAPLLISYCSFSSHILPSVIIISFYIFCKKYFWNVKDYLTQECDHLPERIWFYYAFFIKIYKVLKVNTWWMIKCNLLKLSFVWNFHYDINAQNLI